MTTTPRRSPPSRSADEAADLWRTIAETGPLHFAVRWRRGDVPVSVAVEDGHLVARYVDRAGEHAAAAHYELVALCLSEGRLISQAGWARWAGDLFRAQAIKRGVARTGGHARYGFASAEAEAGAKAAAFSGRHRPGPAAKKSCITCRHLGPACAGPAADPENRLCRRDELEAWHPLIPTRGGSDRG